MSRAAFGPRGAVRPGPFGAIEQRGRVAPSAGRQYHHSLRRASKAAGLGGWLEVDGQDCARHLRALPRIPWRDGDTTRGNGTGEALVHQRSGWHGWGVGVGLAPLLICAAVGPLRTRTDRFRALLLRGKPLTATRTPPHDPASLGPPVLRGPRGRGVHRCRRRSRLRRTQVYSPSIAAASNVYTTTLSDATGQCSSGWFNASNLDVPAGIISTQVTLIGGGGGGSTSNGQSATDGVGGGAQVVATIPAANLAAGSVLYAHLGCGGGAGTGGPTGGAGASVRAAPERAARRRPAAARSVGPPRVTMPQAEAEAAALLCVVAAVATNCNGGTIIGVEVAVPPAARSHSSGAPAVTGATGGKV